MITRRNFVQALGMASVAGAVLNLSGAALGQKSNDLFRVPAEILSDPVLSFTSTHFTPFINTEFEIWQENLSHAELLQLTEVKELTLKANAAEGVTGDSFSLLFVSPNGAQLESGQFEFTHFSLGKFTLTISPVTAEPNLYEAVINHLRR